MQADNDYSSLTGRPTTYTEEVGDRICELMAEGESLRKICKLECMPSTSTVMLWVAKGDRGEEPYVLFSEQYRLAVERRTEYWSEEILDISDDSEADYIYTDEGKRITNAEAIARSRLRVQTRQWLMGKLKPKKYGEKQIVESNNTNTNLNIEAELPVTKHDRALLKELGFSVKDGE